MGRFAFTCWLFSLAKRLPQHFKHQPHKIVKHTQAICWLFLTNYLSVFDRFVGLALKRVTMFDRVLNRSLKCDLRKSYRLKVAHDTQNLPQIYDNYQLRRWGSVKYQGCNRSNFVKMIFLVGTFFKNSPNLSCFSDHSFSQVIGICRLFKIAKKRGCWEERGCKVRLRVQGKGGL